MSVDIAPEYATWLAMWDGMGVEQPPRCRARFVGHPSYLGPVECVLGAGHEDARVDDRHEGGDPLFRWTDADAANQMLMMRVRERLAASAPASCVECSAPCRPVVKGRCTACVAAGIGEEHDDCAEGDAA